MGDIADDLIARGMDEGWGFVCRRGSHYRPRNEWNVTCKHCDMPNLKWRLEDGGRWQLFENERVEHNRLKPHVCPQDKPDPEGFEDVE